MIRRYYQSIDTEILSYDRIVRDAVLVDRILFERTCRPDLVSYGVLFRTTEFYAVLVDRILGAVSLVDTVSYDGNRYRYFTSSACRMMEINTDTVIAAPYNTVRRRSYDTVIAALQYRTIVSIVDRLVVFVVSNLFVDLIWFKFISNLFYKIKL